MNIIGMPKFVCFLFYLLFIFTGISKTQAQFRHFDNIPTREGDVNLSVRQILQDKQGFIWLATFSGLYRYEGDEFILQHRFSVTGKINPDVNTLLQDSLNNIWIGTNNGLLKYNPEQEILSTYRFNAKQPKSIGSNKIRSLAVNSKGQVFVGTGDKGLFLYNQQSDSFSRLNFENHVPIPPVYIKTILIDKENIIWLGTLQNGLYCFKYENGKIEWIVNYREEHEQYKLSNNFVYDIYKDTDGTIVVSSRNGLNVFNEKTNEFEDVSSQAFLPGSTTNFFRSVLRDINGKLWIGTWGGLILCDSFSDIQSGEYELVKHNRHVINSISHNQVMDVFQDKSGIVWLATENGLNRYDPYFNQFQPLYGNAVESLSEQTATDFKPYKNGVLMLTLSDGVLYENGQLFEHILRKKIPEFKNEKFYSLCVDSKQNIWAGSRNGLLVNINASAQSVTSYRHSNENIPIYSIVEFDKNTLAIGTFGEGIKYFDTRTGKFRQERGLSKPIQVVDIFVDSQKRLWAATQMGIFMKNNSNNTVEYFLPDNPDSIHKPNIFIDIAESEDGKIYVGGRNGLYLYNETRNAFENKALELHKKLWVTNLQFDTEQNLWISLNFNKVAKWNPVNNCFFTYEVNNGIRSNPNNQRGFFVDKHNRVFISGFDQIFEFDASEPVKNTYSPSPVFTRLLVNNTEIHPGAVLNNQQILKKNISFQKSIKLNHLNKDFTIYFSSTSFLNAKKNLYRYKLYGYDKNWQLGNGRSARYADLSPGKYSFEVYSTNNDGIWSETPAVLHVDVMPAPLLSPMAFIIYFIVLLAASYFIWQVVVTRIRLKRELLIEKVKRDKEEKFNEERLRFYTNISHELRTPLTLIMGPAKQLLAQEGSNPSNAKMHQLILNNSQRLLSLVNQLLDFRKSTQQGMKLKVTKRNLIEIVESNIEAFSYMANEKNITVSFNPLEEKLIGWFDVKKLDIILFNILSNAFKYGQEKSVVHIEVRQIKPNDLIEADHVSLSITNTGRGIPRHLQEKVFKRFYQMPDPSKSKINTGTGIGLALVKNVVDLHHGIIKLESEPGKLTRFSVYLPIKKTSYKDGEIFDFERDADRRTKELIKAVSVENEEFEDDKPGAKRKKILVIEDNLELRDYLSQFLKSDYKVYTAPDGREGLEKCKTKNPDLVISDVMMDTMNGMQFCKHLKSTVEISHIPVILMTALTTLESKVEGYKTGADDYITKPFEPELLKIRIDNMLKKLDKIKSNFKQDDKVTSKELTVSKIDEEFINKVLDLIKDNLDNPDFDIDNFSKSLNVSASQLYRKIKGVTGIAPNEFIRTYRLREASKMILETNLSMSEIAYAVGFNDSLYFSKCFKKQFGVSPSKYGAQQRKN